MYRIVTRGYCYTLEINTFIQHECIKLIKSDDKAVLHCCKKKNCISNKCWTFELSINQRIL